MESEIISRSVESEEPLYPNLFIFNDSSFIVFMYSKGKGIVIQSKNDAYPVGIYKNDWFSPNFRRFYGTIQITAN
jgi:hypothetical protein